MNTFYVTGGTLRHDAPSYVERGADRELYEGLLRGEFCYVLTSRQMGKSSLMVRTANRLRDNQFNIVALDLTAIGQNLTAEQWYDGLIVRMGRQLRLEDELEDFWRDQERLGPVQRLIAAIRDVALARKDGPLVIFVDEIDTVRSLPFSTDEFFAAIRECYNRRTEDPEFNRLTFCLLGVATPSDLIRDTRTTPFNIGRRVQLNDFTREEASGLAKGLGREESKALLFLDRIFYWTHGHPYLTQKLCQTIAADGSVESVEGVDRACETLFLSNRARERDDNLLFVRERLLRSETDMGGLLSLYARIRDGKRVPDAEANPLITILRLSGIVRVEKGHLAVRNRIYSTVFDQQWVLSNMPNAELRRQREAFRRGLLRGVAAVAFIIILILLIMSGISQRRRARELEEAGKKLGSVYAGLTSYQDTAVIRQDFSMGGMQAVMNGSSAVAFKRPNKIRLVVKLSRGPDEMEEHIISDGTNLSVYLPFLHQYTVKPAPPTLDGVLERELTAVSSIGAAMLYTTIVSENPGRALTNRAEQIHPVSLDEVNGKPAYIFAWRERVDDTSPPGRERRTPSVPVKVWAGKADGVLLQISKDYSAELQSRPNRSAGKGPVLVTSMLVTENHHDIRFNTPIDDSTFNFEPPPDATLVDRFSSGPTPGPPITSGGPPVRPAAKSPFDQKELKALIARRPANLDRGLIDLSEFYNAPLTRTWHGGTTRNDLSELPIGLQTLAGTDFDVRGIIQLSSRKLSLRQYPRSVKNIRIGMTARRLHLLHGAGWVDKPGTQIGSYIIHFAPDRSWNVHLPIIYGDDVRDWWDNEPVTRATVAWTGSSPAARDNGNFLRLYKKTWENPLPNLEIESIDFGSSSEDSAPFLIAITVEP